MSRTAFIIGPSGSGKSTAGSSLNPEETFIFNALGKDLPWRGSAKQYTYWSKDNPKGNMVKTSQAGVILKWLDFIDKDASMQHIKNIIIDDNTFVTALELQRRRKETSWEKYTDIVQNFLDIAEKSKSLRNDIVVFFLHHTKVEGDGVIEDKKFSAMSYGKLIDEKLGSQEAQFTITLRAAKEKDGNDIKYVFYTKDADSTAKTPLGMFDDATIPNDLALVRKTIECYYDENC